MVAVVEVDDAKCSGSSTCQRTIMPPSFHWFGSECGSEMEILWVSGCAARRYRHTSRRAPDQTASIYAHIPIVIIPCENRARGLFIFLCIYMVICICLLLCRSRVHLNQTPVLCLKYRRRSICGRCRRYLYQSSPATAYYIMQYIIVIIYSRSHHDHWSTP